MTHRSQDPTGELKSIGYELFIAAFSILSIANMLPLLFVHNASLEYVSVTITSVGYGDRYPVTNADRMVAILVMTAGVGLFGTLSSFLAN